MLAVPNTQTGDIGLMHSDGSLSIIDRKKDLVKLQGGEYLSLSKIELALSQSKYVEQVCVFADPAQSYALCFVSPKYHALLDLTAYLELDHLLEEGRATLPPEALDNSMLVQQAELVAMCKSAQVCMVTDECDICGSSLVCL